MRISGTLGSPGDVINITESMNDHGLCIGTSEHNVTDLIQHEFTDELRMCANMHSDDENKGEDVQDSKYDNGSGFKAEDIEFSILEINVNEEEIIDDQGIHEQGYGTETVGYLFCIFRPHFAGQRPGDGREYEKDIGDTDDDCRAWDILIVDVDLVDGDVQDEPVDGGCEVTGDEGEQGHIHRHVKGDIFSPAVVVRLHHVEVVVVEYVQKREQTTVDPSSTLVHQLLVVLHGVCERHCVRDVL